MLKKIEMIAGITKNDVEMNSRMEAMNGINMLNDILNRIQGSVLEIDAKRIIKIKMLEILDLIENNENDPIWDPVIRLLDRVD
jgi:hypothetical protein